MSNSPRRSGSSSNDMLALFMRDLDRYPMPNYDEQVELAKRVTAGDEEAKKQMVAAVLRNKAKAKKVRKNSARKRA